jgi:hypothetical protein
MTRARCDETRAVMKRLLLVSVLFAACSKPNDAPALEEETRALIYYYEPILDGYTRRVEHVLQQSGRVPKTLDGSDEALRALVNVHDKLVEMRRIKTDVEARAPKMLASGDRAGLLRTVEQEQHNYAEGCTFVNENLSEVESWLANALRDAQALKTAAPTAPVNDVPEGVIP